MDAGSLLRLWGSEACLCAPLQNPHPRHSLFHLHSGGVVGAGTLHGHREAPPAFGGGRHGDVCDGVGQLVLDGLRGQPLKHGCQYHLIVALPTAGRRGTGAEILGPHLEGPGNNMPSSDRVRSPTFSALARFQLAAQNEQPGFSSLFH